MTRTHSVRSVADLERVARIMKMCVEPSPQTSSPTVPGPLRIHGMGQAGNFDPARDLDHPAARRGADKALKLPSRFGDKLHYRDGRVVKA